MIERLPGTRRPAQSMYPDHGPSHVKEDWFNNECVLCCVYMGHINRYAGRLMHNWFDGLVDHGLAIG